MHRIDTDTAQADKFGAGKNGFTGGNPQTGQLPTALDEDFFDALQEELCSVIEEAGLTPAKGTNAQLLAALKMLLQPLNDNLSAFSGLTGAADRLAYYTAAKTLALTPLTAVGRTLISQATAAEALAAIAGAPLASPVLTGTPKAPTATAGTNDTQLATTAFVVAALNAIVSGFLTTANNLSDLANTATARSNLFVPKGVDKQMCQAWVYFNGNTGAILDSHNISSVVRNSTGQYTAFFTTALSSASFAAVTSAWNTGASTAALARVAGVTSKTTGGANISVFDNNTDAYADSMYVDLVVMGGV